MPSGHYQQQTAEKRAESFIASLCDRLVAGSTVSEACAEVGISPTTLRGWETRAAGGGLSPLLAGHLARVKDAREAGAATRRRLLRGDMEAVLEVMRAGGRLRTALPALGISRYAPGWWLAGVAGEGALCAWFREERTQILSGRPRRRPDHRPKGTPIARTGLIYFVEPVGGGAIKIGFTRGDPLIRLAQIQVSSPVKLHLRGAVPGDPVVEAALHHRFADHRTFGEWFAPAPEILDYLASQQRKEPLRAMLGRKRP